MKRCPNCQTTARRADAETCWYCGFELLDTVGRPKVLHPRQPKAHEMRRRVERERARPEFS